jgi:hypothetical protein
VINMKDLEAPNVWATCAQNSELTLIGCEPLPANSVRSHRDDLLYGWPTVAMTTNSGRLVRFPLLVVTIQRSEELFLVEDADINLNPALLGNLVEPEVAEAIRQLPTKLEGEGIERTIHDIVRCLDCRLNLSTESTYPTRQSKRRVCSTRPPHSESNHPARQLTVY